MAFDPNQNEDDGDIDLEGVVGEQDELIVMSGADEGDYVPTDPDMPDLIDDISDDERGLAILGEGNVYTWSLKLQKVSVNPKPDLYLSRILRCPLQHYLLGETRKHLFSTNLTQVEIL